MHYSIYDIKIFQIQFAKQCICILITSKVAYVCSAQHQRLKTQRNLPTGANTHEQSKTLCLSKTSVFFSAACVSNTIIIIT